MKKIHLGGVALILGIFLALVLITTGTRRCGNVETGKDPKTAIENGDTVRADALPRDSSGALAYRYECVGGLGDNIPFLVVGLIVAAGIVAWLVKDIRKQRTVSAPSHSTINGGWKCGHCGALNTDGASQVCEACHRRRR